MIGASTLALMGLGMTGELAGIIGADYQLAIGKGTSQATGQTLNGDNVEISASGGQTAVTLPTVQAVAEPVFAVNPSGTAALIFVPLGHTLLQSGSFTLNGNLSLATNKAVIFWQYKPKFWASILTA